MRSEAISPYEPIVGLNGWIFRLTFLRIKGIPSQDSLFFWGERLYSSLVSPYVIRPIISGAESSNSNERHLFLKQL